jgi:protein-disulfide isomerase
MLGKVIKENVLERLLPILLVATVILAFAVGILWQKVSDFEKEIEKPTVAGTETASDEPQPPMDGKLSEEQAGKVEKVSDKDHIRGNKDAKVFLIEYSDFECPFCVRFHSTAQQVLDEYGDDVAWIYRHFPLDMHPRARPAAQASECAAELGGEDLFWSFIDEILENQETALSDSGLKNTASKLGLDVSAFSSCVESEKYKDKVEEQYQGGLTAGVTGTPGNFVVNSKGEVWLIPGAVPFEILKESIDEALQD